MPTPRCALELDELLALACRSERELRDAELRTLGDGVAAGTISLNHVADPLARQIVDYYANVYPTVVDETEARERMARQPEDAAANPEPDDAALKQRALAGNPVPEGGIGGVGVSPRFGNLLLMSGDELSEPGPWAELKEKLDSGEIDPRGKPNVRQAAVRHGYISLEEGTADAEKGPQMREWFGIATPATKAEDRRVFANLKHAELAFHRTRREGAHQVVRTRQRESRPRVCARRSPAAGTRAGPDDGAGDQPPGEPAPQDHWAEDTCGRGPRAAVRTARSCRNVDRALSPG